MVELSVDTPFFFLLPHFVIYYYFSPEFLLHHAPSGRASVGFGVNIECWGVSEYILSRRTGTTRGGGQIHFVSSYRDHPGRGADDIPPNSILNPIAIYNNMEKAARLFLH